MQLTVQGKQMDVGDALRTHVTEKIEDLTQKFFNHATAITVTFSRVGHGHGLIRAHISIHISKSISVLAEAEEGEAYLAFDVAAARVNKQLRRYKRRLRDHHERLERTPEAEMTKARDYVLASGLGKNDEEEDVPVGEDPVIVAEITTDIRTMSVSDAVMYMDLAGSPVLLFRNPKHGGLNIVYRRADGNIGWIDPAENAASIAAE